MQNIIYIINIFLNILINNNMNKQQTITAINIKIDKLIIDGKEKSDECRRLKKYHHKLIKTI